jgi:hypothetical protein
MTSKEKEVQYVIDKFNLKHGDIYESLHENCVANGKFKILVINNKFVDLEYLNDNDITHLAEYNDFMFHGFIIDFCTNSYKKIN